MIINFASAKYKNDILSKTFRVYFSFKTFIKKSTIFIAAFPSVDFYVMYGQTEATARLSYLHPEKLKEKTGSIGQAIPGVELKVVDEFGQEQEVGKQGELIAYQRFGGGGISLSFLGHLGCNNLGLVTMPMMSAIKLRTI